MAPGGAGPLRVLRAENPTPLTLDGTRTHLVGRDPVAIIDPGPDLPAHVNAVADAVGGGVRASILLTHAHPDHAAGAAALARRLHAPVRSSDAGTLREGDVVDTDAGPLHVLETPGHTPDHLAFHWPAQATVFVGDLMLGGTDTALVAPPEGDLTLYLRSLERVRALEPRRLLPAHGPPFEDPAGAIARYLDHRAQRLAQVRAALAAAAREARPLTLDAAVDAVYGAALPDALRPAAAGAARAYLHHLVGLHEVRAVAGGWAQEATR